MQGMRQKPVKKLRVAVATRAAETRSAALWTLGALLLTAVAIAMLAWPAKGAPISRAERDLEVRVWTADEQNLPSLEKEVVRLIQVDGRSAFAHHLLAHVLVRFFARDPGDLYLLKQAADLAQQAIDLAPK